MREANVPAVQLAIFAKAPIAGYAKTRLAPLLGAQGAADLQAHLFRRTLQTALQSSLRPISLWCSPDPDHPLFQSAINEFQVKAYHQRGGDLGERMLNAFAELTLESPAVLIGTDCPALRPDHVERCAAALIGGANAAFVPTEDGGYAAVGLRSPIRPLFEGIPWSTRDVMRVTHSRLREQSLAAFETEELWDIDTAADYERAERAGLLENCDGSISAR